MPEHRGDHSQQHSSSAVVRSNDRSGAATMNEVINYARLKELSKELGRPMGTLIVTRRDPFAAGTPGRKADAEWRRAHARVTDKHGAEPYASRAAQH